MQYQEIADHVKRYPKHGQYLFLTYLDLIVARRWPRLQIVDVDAIGRSFMVGEKEPGVRTLGPPHSIAATHRSVLGCQGEIHIVLPACIDEFVDPQGLAELFRNIPRRELLPDRRTFVPPAASAAGKARTVPDKRAELGGIDELTQERPLAVSGLAAEPAAAAESGEERAAGGLDASGGSAERTAAKGPKKLPESIVLAVADHSSTVVYYRVWDGIVPPRV
ncbi:hypothetical protein DFJ74DRAFT_269486 [Hyaloraphidium curvatum]|nr:hypothetical protein DFJ74DRAFT_269486 [Hyaloraphidium curvatum]